MINLITVTEAKAENIIPSPWHAYVPEVCEYCDAPLYINDVATVLKCTNPHCARKLGNQADALLKDLGYKGYGPTTLTETCIAFQIHSIVDFITNAPIYGIVDALNARELSFPALVEMLHIPNLGTKAYKLFDGYTTFESFYEDLASSDNPVAFVAKRVGGWDTANSVLKILADYAGVLLEITDLVEVTAPVQNVIQIAITGHIQAVTINGGSPTKDEYVQYLNSIARQGGYEFRLSSALKSVKFIVADYPSNSRKYTIGKERKVLVSSAYLLQAIQKMCTGGN